MKICKVCSWEHDKRQCPKCIKAYQALNRDKYKEYHAKHTQKMKDLGVKRNQARKNLTVEEKAELNRKRRVYRQENPTKKREENHNYKSKKRGGGALSRGVVQGLLVLQGGECPCCGKELGYDYHLDHIVPVSAGGKNTDDNVQLLLSTCNMQKGTLSMEEFMRKRAESV